MNPASYKKENVPTFTLNLNTFCPLHVPNTYFN